MAWTKCNHGLWDAPEVLGIAAALGIDPIHAAGCCLRVWTWADVESVNGEVKRATGAMVDTMVRVKGFAEAMKGQDWLGIDANGITFPNWERHNSASSKERAMDQSRHFQRRNRDTAGTRPGHFPNKTTETTETTETTLTSSETNGVLRAAIAAEWSLPDRTNAHRDRLDALVVEFEAVGAVPSEIPIRRKKCLKAWGAGRDTPHSLATHWGTFPLTEEDRPWSERGPK